MTLFSKAAFALAALLTFGSLAHGQEPQWRHAASLIGEPKYPEGFAHFDYVNPDAPKGGTVRLSALGSYDTFNPLLGQGETGAGLGLVYETLMERALDEISTEYGLLAEAMSYPADFSSVTFRMNPKARWHDGEPVTAEDVVWSFEQAIKLSAMQANYYHDVTKAEVTGEGLVTFTFDQTGNRELPQIMSELQVLPKHWWEGNGPDGKPRNIGASTLEPPMGSGPYKMKSFVGGRTITYERVPDYWGAGEPTGIGANNFDEIRYEFFRDETVAFEAFKGDQIDFWQESTARRWATGYDFAAATDGRVVKELFENPYRSTGLMIGFLPNLRKDMFKDERVRQALNFAFDFEELNRTLFYGQYMRINSFFFGTELASEGLPQGEELEILQSIQDKVPQSVFTTAYENPVGGDATKLRGNLRQALKLLSEAGYRLDGHRLINAGGEQLSFELTLDSPVLEPLALAYQTNLRSIGIAMSIRTVDSAQYVNRLRNFDFDMVYEPWAQSLSPGNEQRDFWGSAAANQPDSRNYLGIADPGVDALIDKIIFADDRETLVATTRALDRVLLAHHYLVPGYTLRTARVARWDRFAHPETLPFYSIGFPSVWWLDADKAGKVSGQK